MVFYFTATGNCLYVARQLDDRPLSIPQEMKKDPQVYQDETIGIVAPIYSSILPKIVCRFLKKNQFKADYFYMILTYGAGDNIAAEWSASYAEKCGTHVDFVQTVLMVDNYLPNFDMNEQTAMDKHVDEQLVQVKKNIAARKKEIPAPTEQQRHFYDMVTKRNHDHPEINDGEQISVTDKCIGCGTCTRVCPIGNFYIKDGKAHRHSETCEFCLACAQNCPKKAITLTISDKNPNARYRNPHVSVRDIINANCQI